MKKILLKLSLSIVCIFLIENISYAEGFTDAIAVPYQSDLKITPQSEGPDSMTFNNLVAYKLNGLWGFYSKTDKSVHILPVYTEIEGISGYIKVKKGSEWGIIDYSGNQIIQPLYDNINVYSSGKFLVEKNGLKGVVSSDGGIIIPISYQSIDSFNKNYLKVLKDNKYGLITIIDGKLAVPASYDDILPMKSYFKVKSVNKWGVLDNNLKIIVPVNYDDIKILNKTYFGVKNNKKWGAVNAKTGQEAVPVKYERITIGDSGNIRVRQNGKWETYTAKNNNTKNNEVKSISPSSRVFIDQDVYSRTYPSYPKYRYKR